MASTSNMTPDDLEDSTSNNAIVDEHLHFPVINTEDPIPEDVRVSEQQPKQLLKDRLYIGNLHPTVDECVFWVSLAQDW